MQSICGEIFFLFFKLDCWFTVEWWENKAVPAECWGEAFICFIDLVHFCEMFSMYFSFGYKMYPQMIVAAIKLHYPGESSKKRVWNLQMIFFFFFCFGKSLLLGETLSLRYGQVWVQPLHFSEILVGLVLLPFETMNKIKVLPSKLGLSVHCLVRSLVDHRYWHQFKKD